MMVIDQRLSCKIANMGIVGACLVVSLHVAQKLSSVGIGGEILPYFAYKGIGQCAVPFFFIASGFFLAGHMDESGWWGRECKKRVRSLLVPYLFWNVFYWLLMHGLKLALGFARIEFASDLGWGLNLGLNPLINPQHPHLWFLRALMFAVLISPVFYVLLRRIKLIGLLAFVIFCECVSAWLVHGVQDWHRVFVIRGWFQGMSCFSIGIYLRQNPVHITFGNGWRGIFTGVCLAFSVLPWLLKAFIAQNGFDMIARGMELPVLLISVFFLFEAVPHSAWPNWLTSCAFPIYLVHGAILILFLAVCRALGLKDYLQHCSFWFYVLYWMVAIAVSIMITLLMRKVRWLAGVAFGGR